MPIITREELSIRKTPLYFVAVVFAVFIYILNKQGKLNDAGPLFAAAGLVVFLLIYGMLLKNKLIIGDDGILQQLFFGKQKEIKWTDLQSSRLNWHYHGHGANLEWVFISASGKKISLQTSQYSRKQLRLIAEAVVVKCTAATIDNRIRNMAEGKFPWYVF